MRSNLIGNIDPRQMQELPINGQNWMALTLLTPGSRLNAIFETPDRPTVHPEGFRSTLTASR